MVKKSASSLSFDKMQELITCIYDAALDESQWENVLNTLALALHAEQGNMRMLNADSKNVKHVHTFNKDPQWTQAYIDHYIHIDPWIELLLKPKETTLDCTHRLLPDKTYEAMEIHSDFAIPQDVHYGIGGKINISNDSACYMTFQRAKRHQGFEHLYLDVLKNLVPHIQKAVLINEKMRCIEFKHTLLNDTLNQINSPICLVNKYGSILFINAPAEQLINLYDGISIKNNCIFIHSIKDNHKLQELIQQATFKTKKDLSTQGGAMCYKNAASHSSLSILVSPVNPDQINLDTPNDEIALVLFNTNGHRVTLSTELLSDLYDLSPAEARLTFYLCQGLTLDEISEKLSRSKNTLRSQLRSSFNKIGVSRQSDLIHLVNTGPMGIIKRK